MLSPNCGKMCSNIERCVFRALSTGALFIMELNMKKFETSFIAALVLFVCCFGIAGCNTNNGQIHTDETPSNNVSVMEKHVVSISMENYKKFITIETVPFIGDVSTSYYHYFSGALSYAFYDNVIVTYNYNSNSTSTENILTLNVGGCGTITTSSSRYGSSSYEITNVSGTIIYWI